MARATARPADPPLDLTETIGDVRRDGRQRDCRCPAHEDGRASLSVGLGGGGRVLLHCHAGCAYPDIIAAAGLDAAALAGTSRQFDARTTRYEVRDLDGAVVAVHERTDSPDGKRVIWRQPDGRPGLAGRKAATLPLYGAHRLAQWAGRPVVVVEGEKAADSLTRRDVPAVATVTGASGTPSDDVLRPLLAHSPVYLWPDADVPGLAHMGRIMGRLTALGHGDVRTVTWSEAPDGGDAADYTGDVAALLGAASLPTTPAVGQVRSSSDLTFTAIGDLLNEPEESVDWLVEDRIPSGGIVVMAGKPKAGKSTAVRDLALAIARGDEWLGHPCHGPAMVWYLALEGRRRDIRAHFRVMGATSDDLLRVFVGQAPRDVINELDAQAARDRPAAIVIDTMQRFFRATSTDDYAEMTTLFDKVIGIAQRSGAAVILLHHAAKVDRAGIDSILGSTAIAGSADTIILISRSERYRTVSTTQRTGDDLPETVVLMDPETGRVRLGGTRQEADRTLMAAELLAALERIGRPVTREEWLDLIEGRRAAKLAAFKAVTSGNRNVTVQGAGTRNDPRLYSWQAADSGSPVPSICREPESDSSASNDSPNKTPNYSGTQVPTQDVSGSHVSGTVVRLDCWPPAGRVTP